MNRAILGAAGVTACLGIAACGGAAASGAASPTATPSAGGRAAFARNAAFGQLVQINGSTLILSGSTGDSTVTYASTTTITQTSTGTLADITPGTCITATGTKDAAGTLTATSVSLAAAVSGSCVTAGFGGGTFSPRPGATPRPSFSPPAGAAGFTAARGQVKSVTGTSVTLTETTGTVTTTTIINVPTTVKVTTSTAIKATALQTGECVTAVRPKASSGTVAASSLIISPAAPMAALKASVALAAVGLAVQAPAPRVRNGISMRVLVAEDHRGLREVLVQGQSRDTRVVVVVLRWNAQIWATSSPKSKANALAPATH